jgi:uncharacterized protein (TIGR00251 family)
MSIGMKSLLRVKVVPGSSRGLVVGWVGDTLKVKVHQPPDKGRANDALIDLLSQELDIPKSSLSIIRGWSSSRKIIDLGSLSVNDVQSQFEVVG